ncbi:gephyrin-like molybdotransferase Glp [Magnetovibrio sp. PR-2]|uniref:molybdopterin molybdotransferase MoeA n=1 Tax=Magnetovibrio sp. PR-2 TaxID=3120356 RepID=UPI002FCE63F4
MSGLQDDCFRIGDELMPFDEGLEILKARASRVVGMETVSLPNALGRVLAEDIYAPRDVPPHDNSAVDGYAVRHADLAADSETRLPVTARIAAGHPLERASEPGEAVQIFTGAPVPEGMDTVFMQEDIARDGDDVILPAGLKPGANRRKQGEDVREGDIIIETGQMMRAQEIGLAGSVGRGEVKVFRRLRAAVFSTGDEVADPVHDNAGPGAIYDANRYTIGSLLRGMGCEVTDLGILPDRVAEIRSALHDADPGHDLIITSGGVSLGEEDHITKVVQSLGQLDFWRLAIKPGRPMALGKVLDTAFVGLPGNPVAAMVTFMRIARPLILELSGRKHVDPLVYQIPAGFEMNKKKGRREWLRANLKTDATGQTKVYKYPSQGSGILTSMVASDGLVELPEDLDKVAEGDLVNFIPFGEMTS